MTVAQASARRSAVFHSLAVARIGARVVVLLEQPRVPALLHGLQPIHEERRARLPE